MHRTALSRYSNALHEHHSAHTQPQAVLHLAGVLSGGLGQFLGKCLLTTHLQLHKAARQKHAVQGACG